MGILRSFDCRCCDFFFTAPKGFSVRCIRLDSCLASLSRPARVVSPRRACSSSTSYLSPLDSCRSCLLLGTSLKTLARLDSCLARLSRRARAVSTCRARNSFTRDLSPPDLCRTCLLLVTLASVLVSLAVLTSSWKLLEKPKNDYDVSLFLLTWIYILPHLHGNASLSLSIFKCHIIFHSLSMKRKRT